MNHVKKFFALFAALSISTKFGAALIAYSGLMSAIWLVAMANEHTLFFIPLMALLVAEIIVGGVMIERMTMGTESCPIQRK